METPRSRYQIKREIDGGDCYLIPRLSDIHCHVSLMSEFEMGLRQIRHLDAQRLRNSEETLMKSCTSIQDCGAALAPITRSVRR